MDNKLNNGTSQFEKDYEFVIPVGQDNTNAEWKKEGDSFSIFSVFDETYEFVPTLETLANTTVILQP